MKENKSEKKFRQPIVTVMGHVDHGKTSFLDAIRGTKVADKEAGGITQNTRAHEVITKNGNRITFIDTPGHEAFSNMRSRGTQVTDFVLLMVAADDGVQPQTKESIEFAKRNNVPIIVAINKIDLAGVNLQKIKTELSSFGVTIEEYGGDVLCYPISAKNKTGLDELLEGIETLTELNELKHGQVREDTLAHAFTLESNFDKKIGNAALCILKAGSLNERVFGVTAHSYFKVRAYLNESQRPLNSVHESAPFWVTGLKQTIPTGEVIYFVADEKKAIDLQKALENERKVKEESPEIPPELDPESLFAQMLLQREEKKQGLEQKVLNVIVKTLTQGTLEAVIDQLNKLNTSDSKVNILAKGTGGVTEDEINRAKLAKAIIVTFQLPLSSKLENIAKREKVIVRNYEIIYELIDEISDVLDSLEEPQEEEIEIARAKVKQVFVLTNGDIVAGCEVTKGIILKGYRVWVERSLNPQTEEKVEIARGKITSLKQNKNEVKEVKKGMDCGILIDPNATGIEVGDDIVAYKIEKN